MAEANPYDELPYWALPIQWTTPEHLATVSLLHGGPRIDAEHCSVLELGCANGANLLPMAWFRRGCRFTGLDHSRVQVDQALQARDALAMDHLDFVHGDFDEAVEQLDGPYDVILAHGVFSWIDDAARESLMRACSALLSERGLLYLNYNTLPGWTVRGMVRDFLLQQTAHVDGLRERARRCRTLAAAVIEPLREGEHPYTQLMEREFRLVTEQASAYIAHEYLSPENRPFWRESFLRLVGEHGFDYVADADFADVTHRIIDELSGLLKQHPLVQRSADNVADLLCYRQMHSPVLGRAPVQPRPCTEDEFKRLWLASPLGPVPGKDGERAFRHPDGRELGITDTELAAALDRLVTRWPGALPVSQLFSDTVAVREDLEFLAHQGLVTLRVAEPGQDVASSEALHEMEAALHGMATSPWHTFAPVEREDPR